MKGLKQKCLAAGISMIVAGIPGLANAETISEAINELIRTNPEVRAIAYQRLSRDEQVRQARADYYPRLDFMAGTGVQEFYEPVDADFSPQEYRLSLRQNLFTGFATKNNVERTKSHANSGAYRVQSISEETGLEGVRVYLDVLRRQKLLELANENLTNHLRIGDQIQMRSKSGLASTADLDQIYSRIALARSTVISAESNLEDSITRYFKVMGHLPKDLVQPENQEASMPADLDEAQRLAVVNHPTLKAIEEDLKARRSQVGIAKSYYWPVIDLEIDKTWTEEYDGFDGKEEDLLAMLRLRYNFFKGLKDKARIRETEHLVNDAVEARNNTARQALENIRLAWMSYENSRKRNEYLEERVVTSKKTVDAYAKQYRINKRTLLDVLDSEAEWITARSDLLNEQYNYQFAQHRLLSGMGKLIPTLGLEYPLEAKLEEENSKN
jgi:adhesin transport system outer membrane protein